MAIDAYVGNPRSGKSYSVVKHVILPSLREGRRVFTNIPMRELVHEEYPGLLEQLPHDWYSDQDLSDKFPPGSVVVLDELWRRWPSGIKANNFNFKDKEFLAEHGHNVDEHGRTTRVVLVTQDLADIASFPRSKVDKTYRTTKLDAVGADSRFKVDVYQGAVTGQKPPKTSHIRTIHDKYEEKYYRYYKSASKSQTGDVGNESRADKRASAWSVGMIASFVAPVLLIPVFIWILYGKFFGGRDALEAEKKAHHTEVTQVQQPAGPQNPLPPGMEIPSTNPGPVGNVAQSEVRGVSQTWRVVGHMLRAQKRDDAMIDIVLLKSAFGALRYVPATDCEQYSDKINWHCTVDGEQVTPWSGQGGATGWAETKSLTTRTVAVATNQNPQEGQAKVSK